MKNTTHELIIAIAEQGYTDLIMDAARGAGDYAESRSRQQSQSDYFLTSCNRYCRTPPD